MGWREGAARVGQMFFDFSRFAPGHAPRTGDRFSRIKPAAFRADCFALKNSCCQALERKRCAGCAFYKSQNEQLRANERAKARLDRLEREQRRYIRAKYYTEEDSDAL